MHAAAFTGHFRVGAAQEGIVPTGVDLQTIPTGGFALPTKAIGIPVKAFPSPRLQALLDLIGKTVGIAGGPEGLDRKMSDGGVLTMSAAALMRKARHDHVRPKASNDTHHIAKQAFTTPTRERLVGRLRIAEVDGTREELLAAVDAARRQQLLGANDAHQRPLFGADQVLPSLAASRRKIGRSNVSPAREIGDDSSILVVRMCTQYKQTAEDVQALEQALKPRRATERFRLGLKRGEKKQCQEEAKRVSATTFDECGGRRMTV